MIGKNFPVDEHLRRQIKDARTISRTGRWWIAILLFEEPESEKSFLALYKWQYTRNRWKKHSSFRINQRKHLDDIIQYLHGFSHVLLE